MPALTLYYDVRALLKEHVDLGSHWSLHRLSAVVSGIVQAASASPAHVSVALHRFGLSQASVESIGRRIRRALNDPHIRADCCLYPLARFFLCGVEKGQRLHLVVDATTQKDRVVLLMVALSYRGRALPLAWSIWEANVPLQGERMWERVRKLLRVVATQLLSPEAKVIVSADRAFGTPAFLDMVAAYGWDHVVRVQGQTRTRERHGQHMGRERPIQEWVSGKGQRAKGRCEVFKKHRWREQSVVVYWEAAYEERICLVSSLPASWTLLSLYQRRSGIEAMFRDYKAKGWKWEQVQVRDLMHMERLLVGMAIAMWLVIRLGVSVAERLLAQRPTGCRRTVPQEGRWGLFRLGLQRWEEAGQWEDLPLNQPLTDWDAPTWKQQLYHHHAQAYVFTAH